MRKTCRSWQLARYVQQTARGILDESAAALPAPFQHAAWTEIPLNDFGQKVRGSQDLEQTTEMHVLRIDFETAGEGLRPHPLVQ